MKTREAYVFWNAGICKILTYPDQVLICKSKDFRRATRRARNLGYDVRVYKGWYAKAPRDAVRVSDGAYVLPGVGRKK